MQVSCKAYTDEAKFANWPDQFVCPPKIGDWVQALGGLRMKVVSLTHCVKRTGYGDLCYLEVELTR